LKMSLFFILKGTRTFVDVSCYKDIAGMKQTRMNIYTDL
jgi:hypothetical protein